MAKRQRQQATSIGSVVPVTTLATPSVSSAPRHATGDAWFPTGSAATVAAALEYNEPIGRRARIAAERNRRL
jgi:hypothetical protein